MTLPSSGDFAVPTEAATLEWHGKGSDGSEPARVRDLGGWLGLVASALVAVAAVSEVSAAPADPALSPTVHAKSRVLEEWRKSMARSLAPERGCFRADYPETQWKPVPCITVPPRPHAPRSGSGPVPNAVGDGHDYVAGLSGGGMISYAEGSFGTSAVTGESDNIADSYSLQINMNTFSTSACSGVPGCIGWQQYVFDNNPADGYATAVYLQYWLIYHPSNCPSGYTYSSGPGAPGCFKNSLGAGVPVQAINNLSSLAMTGTAVQGGLDQITLYTGTSIYSTYGEDTVLNASSGWTEAEFNVFGYDSSGPVATFSSGTLLSVETMVSNGASKSAPTVTDTGYTFESNNLTLAPLVCQVADPNGPYIWFQESYGATPATTCPVTPNSLPAPTVTTTGPTGTEIETFSFTWPNVSGATYYLMSRNGADSTITGNSSAVYISCQQTVDVQFSSCDAAGCGWPETVLNAKNTHQCN